MTEHVIESLGAYLDGELHGVSRCLVEAHLAKCESCQAELETLRKLSVLLKEAPSKVEFTPVERFVAQTVSRLPDRGTMRSRPRSWEIRWWLVPIGLFSAWIFLQIMLDLSTLVATIGQTGLLGSAATWLVGVPQQNAWAAVTANLLGSNLNENSRQFLQFLGQADVLGEHSLTQFIWQIGIAALYWAWLIVWWLRYRERQMVAVGKLQS